MPGWIFWLLAWVSLIQLPFKLTNSYSVHTPFTLCSHFFRRLAENFPILFNFSVRKLNFSLEKTLNELRFDLKVKIFPKINAEGAAFQFKNANFCQNFAKKSCVSNFSCQFLDKMAPRRLFFSTILWKIFPFWLIFPLFINSPLW